jgi:hypothetical protein
MKKAIFIILIGIYSKVKAQIPVEIFAGHERSTVDIMFFKYFKNTQADPNNHRDRWLFFNRNRASVDYRMTKTTFLPQFGFTEAISYNHEKLKGFAPVLVGQVLSWGVYAKAGIQYAHIKKEITVFTWLVCEILEKPDIDYFLLFRYTPKLSEKINLFTQVESVNALPTVSKDNFSFTQRLRLGLSIKSYQFGAGADFNQSGNTTFAKTYNLGGFIRHEF